MDVKISVIVPIYKVEKYIQKCVLSLLKQEFDSYEIILVDDGSPDKCPSICDDYQRKYDMVKALHKKNGGLGDARNYGVKFACGEYVAFVDSDDYVEPKYLSNMWKLISKFKADMCITKIKRENEWDNKQPREETDSCNYCLTSNEAIFEIYKHEELGWSACGKLFKRSLVLEHPFPKGYYEDCATMYKIVDSCDAVACGDYLYNYHYINHENSILQSELRAEHYRIFDICEEFEKFVMERNPENYLVAVIFKRAAVTQMLNCQRMSWKEYRGIFNKYRHLFRKNLIRVMTAKQFSAKNKMYMALYCTFPAVVKSIEKCKRG